MSYKNIPFGSIDKFNAVVEIPEGSENKYEYDVELDTIKLDWVFTDGFKFIFNYGYIPETLGGDGDHLDVFILSSHPIAVGVVVECRTIGMIELLDRGEEDNKILAVPLADLGYKKYKDLDDLNFDYKQTFGKFFQDLAKQKNKIVEIKGFVSVVSAKSALEKARKNFKQ